jgi:hypothetical protein
LHNLVNADRLSRPQGRRVRLQLGPVRSVRRAIELTGISAGLDCVSTREEALAQGGKGDAAG